ncbi:MAG: fimbrillin family protein [Bacteroidaceae bacterium]|nr:fimbrillin family protein [Bacteroidaceae bacterium]
MNRFKIYLSLFLAVGLLFSCRKEEGGEVAEQEREAIAFTALAKEPVTRADMALLATDKIPNGKSIGVYAYYHDDSQWAAGATPNFMFNQLVTNDATRGDFVYSPLKYWPNEETDKLSFIGYYPYTEYPVDAPYTVADANPATGIKPQLANTGSGLSSYLFQVNDDVTKQVDFMVSGLVPNLPVSRALEEEPGNPFNNLKTTDRVPLVFHHMTSQIEFRVEVDDEIKDDVLDFTMRSLNITNIKSRGLLTPTYDAGTGETSFAWTGHAVPHTYPIDVDEIYLLLPQVLGDESYLTMSYDLRFKSNGTVYTYDASGNAVPVGDGGYTYQNLAVSLPLNSLDLKEWLLNYRYIYLIRLGARRIEFTAQVVEWGQYIWTPLSTTTG